jgi:hypothetical protein
VQFLREIFGALFDVLDTCGEQELTDDSIPKSTAMAWCATRSD